MQQPAVRLQKFREDFMKTRAWLCLKHVLLNDVNDGGNADVHRTLCRRLHCEFILMNGIETNHCIKLLNCVEKGIRTLYPRKVYMGFKRSYDNNYDKDLLAKYEN